MPFMMSLPESVGEKDLEKTCLMIVIHEIHHDPLFLVREFETQKKHPNLAISDWITVKLAKKFTSQFINSPALKTCQTSDKPYYEIEKIRMAIAKIVEAELTNEVDAFEK
jgi:hypothetical protein